MSRQLRRSGVPRSNNQIFSPTDINSVIARLRELQLQQLHTKHNRSAPTHPPSLSPQAPHEAKRTPLSSAKEAGAANQGKEEHGDEKKGKEEQEKKGKVEERVSLTVGGEVVGGFEDFVSGAMVLSLPGAPQSAPLPPHILLKNWQVLWDAVPLWRFFKPTCPDLASVFALETGAGGDCLFHAVSAGYNHVFHSLIFHMEVIRDLAAQQLARLTEAQVAEFIIDWIGHLPEDFKRMTHAERVNKLQKSIRANGNEYWGETGTLRQLLLKSPPFSDQKIGFAVLNIRKKPVKFRLTTDNEKSSYERRYPKRKAPKEVPIRWEPRVETTIIRLPDTKYLMFLHCLENSHWILIGYAPNAEFPQSEKETPIGSTFPIDAYPKPLFPFIQEQ